MIFSKVLWLLLRFILVQGPQSLHGKLNHTCRGLQNAISSKRHLRSCKRVKSWPNWSLRRMLASPVCFSKTSDSLALPVNTSIRPTFLSKTWDWSPNHCFSSAFTLLGSVASRDRVMRKLALRTDPMLLSRLLAVSSGRGFCSPSSTQLTSSYSDSTGISIPLLGGPISSCWLQQKHAGSSQLGMAGSSADSLGISGDRKAKIATLMAWTGRRSWEGGLILQGATLRVPQSSREATEQSYASWLAVVGILSLRGL